jgi:hypothetical protein
MRLKSGLNENSSFHRYNLTGAIIITYEKKKTPRLSETQQRAHPINMRERSKSTTQKP